MKSRPYRFDTGLCALLAVVLVLPAQAALAAEIRFRSFSSSAAIGPPAEAYAAKLTEVSRVTLGEADQVKFVKLAGTPVVPSQFGGNIMAAVAAGSAGGGFDAAYNSGSDLNRAWGFIYNSGVPFGPTFEEFMGFLYGKSVNGQQTGLELMQSILQKNNSNVVVVPIVGSPDQLSGYFPRPIGNAPGQPGIGLKGLCSSGWKLRYLTPGENVLRTACDQLAATGAIPANTLSFITAIPGGGSLVAGLKSGLIQGFEFATPVDDLSQVFNTVDNPGTLGARYVHLPGWQQQYLVTWMIINKQVWDGLTLGQQALVKTVARDHLISSYAENMRQQGDALRFIMDVNRFDGDPSNDMVLVKWPDRDQELLSAATIHFLNARLSDTTLSGVDRADYETILEAFRKYVRSSNLYWRDRGVSPKLRFDDWANAAGERWDRKANQ
jgi:TRAP-type mannitol/chloroaromatic compound transport system substrate-binding protein